MSDKNIPDQVDDFDDDVPAITEEDKKRAQEQNQKVEHEVTEALNDPDDLDENATISFASQPPRNTASSYGTGSKSDKATQASSADSSSQTSQPAESAAAESKPDTKKSGHKSFYERLNRAQPQQIPASKPIAADTDLFDSPAEAEPAATSYADSQFAAEPTQGFGDYGTAQPVTAGASATAPASSSYADQDFAAPEPSPTAAPLAAPGAGLAAPVAGEHPETTQIPQADAEEPYDYEAIEKHARGTIDFGLFLLRIFLACWLILESVATFFSLGEREGVSGLEAQFVLNGYNEPALLSILIPSLELAAGVFLLFGVLSPVAAAVAIAATGWNFFDALNATENVSVWQLDADLMVAWFVLLIAIAIQFTGPGRWSVDSNRSWTNRPLASSWIFCFLGMAGAISLWWFGAGVNPLG